MPEEQNPKYGTLKLILIMSFGLFSVLASGTTVFIPSAIVIFEAIQNCTMMGLLYLMKPGDLPWMKK